MGRSGGAAKLDNQTREHGLRRRSDLSRFHLSRLHRVESSRFDTGRPGRGRRPSFRPDGVPGAGLGAIIEGDPEVCGAEVS